jgi:type IV secretion system protein VirD4
MAYLPGYNVRILMVIQASSQLRDVYGMQQAETMMKSVAARIVFAPKDFSDAKEISDDLGFTTVKVRSHSRPSAATLHRATTPRSSSVSTSEHARALLLPQEVKEIGLDAAVIFLENLRPIRCHKIRYYDDRHFKKRLLPPPSRPTRSPPGGASTDLDADLPPLGDGFEPQEPIRRRHAASMADLERIDSLTLADFGGELQHLKFEHAGARPTESEFDADVALFLDAVR